MDAIYNTANPSAQTTPTPPTQVDPVPLKKSGGAFGAGTLIVLGLLAGLRRKRIGSTLKLFRRA